jgi:hypothetical protein
MFISTAMNIGKLMNVLLMSDPWPLQTCLALNAKLCSYAVGPIRPALECQHCKRFTSSMVTNISM